MSCLLSDMGGTNIRFAVADGHGRMDVVRLKCADFSSFEDALTHFLNIQNVKPLHLILAVPGPVTGDNLSFVNNPWHIKISKIKKQFEFSSIDVMNDFSAQALAILGLQKKHFVQIATGRSDKNFPSLIIGAGTGLGVGILLPDGKALPSEGGHIALTAADEAEEEILKAVFHKYGRVSAERLISGPGLCFLYEFFAHDTLSSEQILQKALAGDKKALQAVLQMFAFWGSVCGDLAMAFCAKGGVYLSGGIIQAEGAVDLLKKSDFRKRFEEKGRHKAFMESIPTYAIIQQDVAFIGLKQAGKKYLKE